MNRRQFSVGSAALLATLPFAGAVEPAGTFPPPLPFAPDPRQRGRLTRSLTLLATSTPQRRHRVRVLFYGQSITEQDWWKSVASHLRTTYPHADLVIENRAIGGHAAQLLVKTAEADLARQQAADAQASSQQDKASLAAMQAEMDALHAKKTPRDRKSVV